jgi:hypothetical protein
MKIRNHRRHFVQIRSFVLISAFMIAVAAVAVPFYSVQSKLLGAPGSLAASARQKADANRDRYRGTAKTTQWLGWGPTLNLPAITGETIAIFAADCSTPKDSFNLGEVICAKTDGVDLSVPGNYYVDFFGPNGTTNGATITQNPQYSLFALPTSNTNVGTWKANIGRVSPAESSIIGNPPNFTVSEGGPAIAIFASDCTTPKSLFNLQDADKTVCAKVTGGDANQNILWSNARFELVQDVPLGTGENSFTLSSGSSLGDWRVILFEPFGGSVYAVTSFTVIDAANPSADIAVSKGTISSSVAAGSQAVFTVQVTNLGPDASTVQVTDSVPANTTFNEFAPTVAPVGTSCAKPAVGASSGNVVCTLTLARGETADFLGTYDVISGTPSNTVISNTASVSSSVSDPNSANDSSTATVTVSGSVSETCTLDCPANVVVTANTTQGTQFGAVVTYGAATGTGNCGAVTNSPASGSFFAVGTYSVVSTSELGGATCSFTVTVLDTNPPTISCPANITATAPTGATDYTLPSGPGTPTINASGGGTVTGVRSDDTPATYDDNGNVITPAVVHALTDPYPIGSTGILWTVTDAGGRTASCSQIITIVAAGDRPPVTISCPANVSVTAPSGSCEATISAATIGTPTTNPSDANVTVAAVRSDGLTLSDPFPAGTTVITWTATDNTNGSVASCTQNVTVIAGSGSDTTPPVLTVPPNVTATTSSCTATLDDELGTATATDSGACGGTVTITRTGVPANFVFPTGTTIITYTATDAAGNTSTGVQLVTVTESPAVPPTISAPADVIAYTGAGATSCGTVVNDATLGTATASDNCPGVTVARTGVPAGNNFPVGDTFITYTATDRSGNTATATQKVTVVDNTVPIVAAPGTVTLYTGAGSTSCSVTVSNLDTTLGTGSATDNCPGVSAVTRTGVPAGNVFPVGDTVVTYSATDAHGNTGSANQTVTVVDNTPPTISCPANITLEPTCPTGAIATYAAPVVGDNCGVQGTSATTSPTINLASGSVFPIGTTTVTNTVTDIHGNSSSCSFTVTVKTVFQTIEDLKTTVNSSSLSGTQRQGLTAKLNAAEDALNQGHPNTACQKLADFINSVQNYISLGDFSAAVGNAWISKAAHVRNTIVCSYDPCT